MTEAKPSDGTNIPFGNLRAALLGVVRSGPREVLWTLPGLGFGNFLFHWLWAHAGRLSGTPRYVVAQPEMSPWLEVFPALRELTLDRRGVRRSDKRRVEPMSDFNLFVDAERIDFVRTRLLIAPLFESISRNPASPSGEVLVHVRRGSYYQDPELAAFYGMDTPSFIRVALEGAATQAPIRRIRVVSNDLGWCRSSLTFLEQFAPATFGGVGASASADFRDLALSRRLVLSNSTFSYWAAYVSEVIHHDNHALIWAPLFQGRGRDWRSPSLDPRWSIVGDLPGGWADPEL